MKAAEVLDRALKGEQAPGPGVAELVELARGLDEAWAAAPSVAASKRGLALALDAFQGDGHVVSLAPRVSRVRRIAASAAVAVAALVAVPGIARAASDDTLPGDLLYPIKLGFENLRLALADGPAEQAAIHLTLSKERLEEAVLAELLRRPDAEREAVRRYTASIVAFEADVDRARALGLDVAVLVSRSDVLLERQNDVLVALIARPPDPAVPGIQRAIEAIQRAKGHDRERGRGAEKADRGPKDKPAKAHGKPAEADKDRTAGKSKGKDRGRPAGQPAAADRPSSSRESGAEDPDQEPGDKGKSEGLKNDGPERESGQPILETIVSGLLQGRT
jgi:hypothetical protein